MILAAALLLASQAPASVEEPGVSKPPPGFTALFNGQDLDGWRGRPHLEPGSEASYKKKHRATKQAEWDADRDLHWRVENGELVNDGQGVFLTTAKDYADFDLRLEYKTVALADSGIYLRGVPQVQIWDWTKAGGKWKHGADKGSGGLWNNQKYPRFPIKKMDRPFGKWNSLRILMTGARVSVWMNDELTVPHVPLENYFDRARPVPASGPIQLQTHGGEIRWRNIFLKPLAAEESNAILAANQAKEFKSVFNGKDFVGWCGPTDGYEVVNGALRCKPGHGGTIYTDGIYKDFVARLQFKLPAGGNNGLAIRYPGHGNTAYEGMCELQVLDNTAKKYAGLKPYQYHGSAYGMVPAARGFQRPVGEWNFQEVTVKGNRIIVELNGFFILDTDLGEMNGTMDGKDHPGLKNAKGHFGFAGHNDPVEFKEVSIRSLD